MSFKMFGHVNRMSFSLLVVYSRPFTNILVAHIQVATPVNCSSTHAITD